MDTAAHNDPPTDHVWRRARPAGLLSGHFLERRWQPRAFDPADPALLRAIELRRITAIGVTVYVAAVALFNLFVVARPSLVDMFMQMTVLPATVLLISDLFQRPDMPVFAREAASTVIACLFCLATALEIDDSPGENCYLVFAIACLPVAYVLLFARLRRLGALTFVAFAAFALSVALVERHNVPAAQIVAMIIAMLGGAATLMVAMYRRPPA
jgi:hypothetical protein